jgi:hypothetical protein
MFNSDINRIIIIELKTILTNLPEDERSAADLIKAFEDSLEVKITKTKPKVKRPTVILEDSIRCLALKKDGDRCNGRKKIEETLCSLHKRNGVKFGSYTEGENDIKPIVVKKKVLASEKDIIKKIVSAKSESLVDSESEPLVDSESEPLVESESCIDEELSYEQYEF